VALLVTYLAGLVVSCDKLHAGVLELIEFIRKENIKTLVEHIVDQHMDRYAAVPH